MYVRVNQSPHSSRRPTSEPSNSGSSRFIPVGDLLKAAESPPLSAARAASAALNIDPLSNQENGRATERDEGKTKGGERAMAARTGDETGGKGPGEARESGEAGVGGSGEDRTRAASYRTATRERKGESGGENGGLTA